MKFRVYYDDTDAQGIVYHANYLRFCERARSEYIFRTLGKDAFSGQSYFVLTSINAKFRASARLGDEIEVRSVCARNSDLAIILAQEILLGDKVVFSADVQLAWNSLFMLSPMRLLSSNTSELVFEQKSYA